MQSVITACAGLRAHEESDDFIIGESEDVKGLIKLPLEEVAKSTGGIPGSARGYQRKFRTGEGESYTQKKCTNPTRIVTTSVFVEGGCLGVVSVKTQKDVRTNKIFEILNCLKGVRVKVPIQIGDVIVENVAEMGIVMNQITKIIYLSIGFITLTLGGIGILLPILPTTPFLLIASFCFVRGSTKIDIWFKNSTIYKKHLAQFVEERSMTLKQKIKILLFADIMIAIPVVLVDHIAVKIFLVLVMLIKAYYFLFKIRTIKIER